MKKWFGFLAILLALGNFCLASFPAYGQRLLFQSMTQGLRNLNINAVAQDRAGFLWVGTENGLYRYDGFHYRRYGAAEGVRARTIENIFLGPDGALWIGSTTGVFFQRPDGGFSEVLAPAPQLEFSTRVGAAFAARSENQILLADRNGLFTLTRNPSGRWSAETVSLAEKKVWSLFASGETLYWGSETSFSSLPLRGAFQASAAHRVNLPEDQWRRVVQDGAGHLWLCGSRHVAEISPQEGWARLHDLPGASGSALYVGLTLNSKGQIVVSQGTEVGVWEGDHWQMIGERAGLERSNVSALYTDREGQIWIAQVGHGLKRWVGEDHWEALTTAEGLSNNIVWSTLRDHAGRMWIGTESGLDWIPAHENAPRPWTGAGISTARAMALAESADGAIWMGSGAGGVARINPATLHGTAYQTPAVYRLLADHEKRLWIATAEGLFVVGAEAGSSPRLVHETGTTGQRFTDLTLDADHRLLAASSNGLYRLENEHWRRLDPGLNGANPTLLAADRNGNLWVAGNFPGLMRLRLDSERVVEAEHIQPAHMASEKIVSLAVDSRGWLWIGQDAGLTVFDGKNWRTFTRNDGLLWSDCNSYALREEGDGSLWIGTSGGLAHLINPASVLAPPAYKLTLANASLAGTPFGEAAALRWQQGLLVFTLGALNFLHGPPPQIRYRLLGLEEDWHRSEDGVLLYGSIAPGDYRLQAVAEDATGAAASPMLDLPFRILPLWWQSAPLRWTAAILAILCAFLFWNSWMNWRRINQKNLEELVQQRTQTLEQERAELQRMRERMHHMAEYDDLTGLWTRRIILERLRSELDRARRHALPISILLIDLDRFRKINEDAGQQNGDRILQELSRILLRAVRSYDLVGRYNGGMFIVILPGSNAAAACARAEELRQAFAAARLPAGIGNVAVTASFGVASSSQGAQNALLDAAARALRRAKSHGRNCVMLEEVQEHKGVAERSGALSEKA